MNTLKLNTHLHFLYLSKLAIMTSYIFATKNTELKYTFSKWFYLKYLLKG